VTTPTQGAQIIAELFRTSSAHPLGPVVRGFVSFGVLTTFFWWTMHFLLAGRVSWRRLFWPAFTTALFWLGLALVSSIYFSAAVISEDKLYGVNGVVFTLVTWFIAIGAVIVLGASCGAVWQARLGRPREPGGGGKCTIHSSPNYRRGALDT
jgi:uncharacterized BrkB/YihY/UPF0761 family membrane protein